MPTTPVLEPFSSAAGNLGGPNWGFIFGGDPALRYDGTGLGAANTATPANSENRWIASTFGQDEEVYVTIPTLPAASSYVALYYRISGQGGTGYEVEMDSPVSGSLMTWKIFSFNGITFSELLPTGGVTATAVAGDQFLATGIGSAHTIYKNGTALISRTDSTYMQSGAIGIQINDATVRVDDFGGGDSLPLAIVTQDKLSRLMRAVR